MDYLEYVKKTSPSMLKLIWQITQKFLTAFGIPFGPGCVWNYKPPSCPPSKIRKILLPDQIYNMIHYNYTKDKTKNIFIQYTLLHSCIFGWRNPSELCLLKLDDVDLDNNSIVITEKKKHNRKRLIITDYLQIIDNIHVKSFKNWIDVWRPRISSQHSQDYLYISPRDGRPLREMQYTRYINYYVNPVFPSFKLYDTRHFCATGLFICEKLKTGYWNKYKVKRHLGHERDSSTDIYIRYAEQYIKIAPFDWCQIALRLSRTQNHRDMTALV